MTTRGHQQLPLQLSDFWTWQGRVGRAKYVAIGAALFALKHNLDRVITTIHGYEWGVFNYWVFSTSRIDMIDAKAAKLYATLIAVALPFIYVGVVLTVRRLRDAGLPLWFVFFFFLPFINLFFFLVLAVLPSTSSSSSPSLSDRFYRPLRRLIPDNELGSAALGVAATTALAVLVVVLGSEGLGNYGWGLFVGVPFFLGLNSVLIYGIHRPRAFGRCVLVAVLSVGLAGFAVLALAIEGIVCLVMAAPLALVIAIFGGFIGYVLQQRNTVSSGSLRVVSLVFLVMPGFVALENALSTDSPPMYEVKTSVVVKAIPQQVWPNVVAFAELPPPTEALFQTGIAYPTRAHIDGHGVGAVRHCIFSTGEFVEPITVWDEPRLLQFDVRNQPPVMNEWSPYKDLHPPHLENYLSSRKGQFLLTALPDGTTRLEGTTWYQNRFWPAVYWHWWSDYIIHRIHMRVLLHIKNLSETE